MSRLSFAVGTVQPARGLVGFHANSVGRRRTSVGPVVPGETIERRLFQTRGHRGTRRQADAGDQWQIRSHRTTEMGRPIRLHVSKRGR